MWVDHTLPRELLPLSRVNHRAELADPLLQAVRRARAAAFHAAEEAELALWEALESGRSVAAVARAFDVRPRTVARSSTCRCGRCRAPLLLAPPGATASHRCGRPRPDLTGR